MSLDQAFVFQQRVVAAICREFPNGAAFQADFGVRPPLGRPDTTARVERVIAASFGAESCVLVQGAGTGAIRNALAVGPATGEDRRMIVHRAPAYKTTSHSLDEMCIERVPVDYNDGPATRRSLESEVAPDWVLIQHTRQSLEDEYDPQALVSLASSLGKKVIVDDNYAVLRTPAIGVEVGAEASAFSFFKLHGPVGVGAVVGHSRTVDAIHDRNYSGGGQVQGTQALECLQALVDSPLNWATQSAQCAALAESLSTGAVPGVVEARLANAQDLCVIALLDRPIATEVRAEAEALGASPYPVGSNSKYEIAPLVYRMSSSTLAVRPDLADRAIRINPMRASAQTVLCILQRAISQAEGKSSCS